MVKETLLKEGETIGYLTMIAGTGDFNSRARPPTPKHNSETLTGFL